MSAPSAPAGYEFSYGQNPQPQAPLRAPYGDITDYPYAQPNQPPQAHPFGQGPPPLVRSDSGYSQQPSAPPAAPVAPYAQPQSMYNNQYGQQGGAPQMYAQPPHANGPPPQQQPPQAKPANDGDTGVTMPQYVQVLIVLLVAFSVALAAAMMVVPTLVFASIICLTLFHVYLPVIAAPLGLLMGALGGLLITVGGLQAAKYPHSRGRTLFSFWKKRETWRPADKALRRFKKSAGLVLGVLCIIAAALLMVVSPLELFFFLLSVVSTLSTLFR